jgi:hypothetical protein
LAPAALIEPFPAQPPGFEGRFVQAIPPRVTEDGSMPRRGVSDLR